MNKKIYTRRLYNEDTSFYWDILKYDLAENNYFIGGNRGYEGINSDSLKFIYDNIINYSDYEVQIYYRNNIVSYIIDNIRSHFKQRLNIRQAWRIIKAVRDGEYNGYNLINDEDLIEAILSEIYNKKYLSCYIRGYSQGDWNILYYPEDGTIKKEYIEAVYWGTGIEIEIHDGEAIPETPEDICGYTFYTFNYKIDDIKDDIAKETNCKAEDIIYYDITDVKEIRSLKIIYSEAL